MKLHQLTSVPHPWTNSSRLGSIEVSGSTRRAPPSPDPVSTDVSSRQTHLGAGRPIKHPRWNLQPTVRVGCSQVAAKDNTARSLNCLMNAAPQAGPWMPRIQQLPKLGIPHSSLGYLTPQEFAEHWRAAHDNQQTPDAAPRPATGRAAAVVWASPPRPVAGTPIQGQT